MRTFTACCLSALAIAASARAADVDWRIYGAAVAEGLEVCFYDASSVAASENYIRVRTKCLRQKDLDGVNTKDEPGKGTVRSSARKVLDGYVPPFALLEHIDFDRTLLLIQYEQIADLDIIQPSVEILYEINCSEQMTRTLGVSGTIDGKYVTIDKPTEWKNIGPVGNPENLHKILCTLKSYNKP
jgi:hypothetical protein